jgi:hypothetical protein
MTKSVFLSTAILIAALATTSNAANLILNGGFELTNNGYSETLTPVDWTNVGHIDGVIAYSLFGTPAYDGSYFYDLGGFGQPTPNQNDGIEQTVTTSVGSVYTLVFGLTSENGSGNENLNVLVNGSLIQTYALTVNGSYGNLAAPFVTETLSFTASSTSSTILFTVTGAVLGNNDPMIDGISLNLAGNSSVPEPATWFTCLAGLALSALRFRKFVSARV